LHIYTFTKVSVKKKTQDIYILHAEFCGALANDKRLKILHLIGEKECPVGEIAHQLDISPSNVSQHLRIMRGAGVVTSRKEGTQIYYSASSRKFVEGYRLIREGLAEVHSLKSNVLFPEDRQRQS
jgi:ArsR family transcriptional regulator